MLFFRPWYFSILPRRCLTVCMLHEWAECLWGTHLESPYKHILRRTWLHNIPVEVQSVQDDRIIVPTADVHGKTRRRSVTRGHWVACRRRQHNVRFIMCAKPFNDLKIADESSITAALTKVRFRLHCHFCSNMRESYTGTWTMDAPHKRI